jgi:hypothetical protein
VVVAGREKAVGGSSCLPNEGRMEVKMENVTAIA